MINSQGYDGMYGLINPQNGTHVTLGEQFLKDGLTFKIEGGRAPHKQGSTGRIWVREVGGDRSQQEVFPHVYDLRWVRINGVADPEGPQSFAACPKKFIGTDPGPIERRILDLAQHEVLDHFFTIEVQVSAQRAIGGKAYWDRVQNSDMSLYQRAECDDALIKDYQTARRTHGPKNVRIVEVTKTLVAQSV